MILQEAIKSIKASKILTSVIILLLIAASLVCNLVLDKLSSVRQSHNKLDQTTQKSYFWITEDLHDNELEHRFWNSENSYDRIRGYYQEMATSNEYKYLEFCKQVIWIKDSYGKFIEKVNRSLNLSCLNEFGINVIEGRLFTEEEMNVDFSTQTIPIILGYNLRNRHQIGDTFEGKYMLRDVKFKVIGVLEPNSYIILTNIGDDDVGDFYHEYLDNAYITPMVNCIDTPKSKDEKTFIRVLYMFKLNSIIAAPADYNSGEIRAKMDDLANKYDMYDFEVISISKQELKILKLVCKDSIDIMTVLAAILFVFSFICLFAIMSVKMNKNVEYYAIHLMVGASRQRIILYILTEIILVVSMAHSLSYVIIRKLIGSQIRYTLTWLIVSLLAFMAAALPSIYQMMHKELDTLLLGDAYE